jgi:asparagine synthase (glutamine-hydrolysing)
VPYLDHRFFEFCARLDPQLKQRGRTGKYLLKRLAEKLLPLDVVHRSKQGFMPPLAEWFRGTLKGEAQSAFARLTQRGLFKPGAIERLAAAARPSDAGRLWALFVLERWFQRYAPQYAL